KNGMRTLTSATRSSRNGLSSRRRVSATKTKRLMLGRYIVADPKICHGKPTFRGTRIMVADVLEMVASGMAWETIIEEWNGHINDEAITEAVGLARHAFLKQMPTYIAESVPA
ncbi:MAG: DUF433 domain-containing protein, partial [Chloroflexota bacterium]